MAISVICAGCNVNFEARTKTTKYCDNCRENGVEYICEVCGKASTIKHTTHSTYVNKNTEVIRRCQKCAAFSKEALSKRSQSSKATWAAKESNHPHKISATQRLKNAWNNPDVVARHKAASNTEASIKLRSELTSAYFENPEKREHARQKSLEVWKNPEYRARWKKGGVSYEKAIASHNAYWSNPDNHKHRNTLLKQTAIHTELSTEKCERIQEAFELYAYKNSLTERLAELGAKEAVIYIRENSGDVKLWQELVDDIIRTKGGCYRLDLCSVTGYNRHTVGKYCVKLGVTGITSDLRGLQSDVEFYIRTIYTGEIEVDRKYSFVLNKQGNPQQLDIYLPEIKVAVEVNGFYWHSMSVLRDKYYHFEKSRQCREACVHLIHIWEHDWNCSEKQMILKSILASAVGAAECVDAHQLLVVYKKTVDVRDFFNNNCIQGFCKGDFVVCLVDKAGEIWMAFLLSKNKVVREAVRLGYMVVGGSNKLIQALLEDKQLDEIVYIANYNYSLGLLNNQWELVSEQPKLKKISNKGQEPICCEKIKSDEILRVWDAGIGTYIFRRT